MAPITRRPDPAPAAPVTPTRRPRTAAVAAVALVASLSLTGAAPPSAAVRKDDRFLTAQTPGVLHIEAGECFSDPFHYARVGEVVVVYTPCDQPPVDNQVYGFVEAADGPWNRDAVADLAWRRCGAGFTHHWSTRAESGLDYFPVLPTEETWADGDRTVMCVVYDPAGRLAGSVLPSAR
ncbi:hypothetical protein O7632_16435 [Solwaraspora sp. WMMD406]|uniref:hypothetical protein n=1 Tax=Solwaraspora sp. WMMD406 TaxID=3016095 RepID=UPI0024176A5D|nr:hypothetical protein [Solwaraspora sp. WMMD406]MDG4765673.1 hypothetical protein [Solwaraspora sp. WMMD406]